MGTMDTRSRGRVPGPAGVPLLGNVLDAWRDPLRLLMEARRDHGPTVGFRFGTQRYVVVHRPEDIRHVLVTHRDNYPKSRNYRGLRLVLGDGLLTSEGELWKRQRKLTQPAFHHQAMVGLAESMGRCTSDMLDRWDRELSGEARAVDVHEEMMRLTFRIVGRTLCSVDLDGAAAEMGSAIGVALRYANEYVEKPLRLPPWVPTPENLRFRRALATLDRLISDIIEERRRCGERRGDLLDLLMASTDGDGGPRMSDRQLRDELMTLVLAGHETTAVALSWAWYLLSRHPEVERRLAQEAQDVIGARAPAFDELSSLEYAGRVVNEAMRLYPPAWVFERQALADDLLDGFRVPAGTVVAVAPWTLHRDPLHWDNPEGFDPDRFAPERAGARDKYAYMPFGGGPRVCIGNHFALLETKIVLATVAARYRLDLVPGQEVEPEAGITLRPRRGVRMIPRRRDACQGAVVAA